MSSSNLLEVSKLGKVVGLRGELKLHLTTDFPEQFVPNKEFILNKNQKLTIESYNESRGLVKFREIHSREEAFKYVNKRLFSTIEETKEDCSLKKDEFFWFDIIGCKIVEDGEILGVVKEIEEMGSSDYLSVDTDLSLKDLPKNFYIPYIDKYIESVDVSSKTIYTKEAKLILENS